MNTNQAQALVKYSVLMVLQDGELVEFSADTSEKHSLRRVGRRFIFSVNGLTPDDAGLYQVDVEGINIFSTDFKRKNILKIPIKTIYIH